MVCEIKWLVHFLTFNGAAAEVWEWISNSISNLIMDVIIYPCCDLCWPRSMTSHVIWVRSRKCGCLVTWFCYHLMAKPRNKTAAPSWRDPCSVIQANALHCSDVSYELGRLKSPTALLFVQQLVQINNNEMFKALHHWPLWWEPSVTGGFPSQMVRDAESVNISSVVMAYM